MNTGRIGGADLGEQTPVLLYPSWMDPRYVLSASTADLPEARSAGIGVVLTIPADSERWGLGIVAGSANISAVFAGFTRDPASFPFASIARATAAWFPLAVYGPLVCAAWYLACADAFDVQVISVRRF